MILRKSKMRYIGCRDDTVPKPVDTRRHRGLALAIVRGEIPYIRESVDSLCRDGAVALRMIALARTYVCCCELEH